MAWLDAVWTTGARRGGQLTVDVVKATPGTSFFDVALFCTGACVRYGAICTCAVPPIEPSANPVITSSEASV